MDERARVVDRAAAGRDREVVAAVLPLDPHALRHPPHRRVVEEQRLCRGLDEVDEVVVAADVGQLVGQISSSCRAEAGEDARWQQDRGPHIRHRGR
jgi:hypothetical protein